jgi:hypothetical protein
MRPFLVALVALLAVVGSSLAADRFVTVGGTGDCSQASPCGDVATAYAAASTGDSILLAAGTYIGTGNSAVVLATKVVRIAPAAVGVRPVIDLTAATDRFLTTTTTSVTIEGLTIANGATYGAIALSSNNLPSTQITFKCVFSHPHCSKDILNSIKTHLVWFLVLFEFLSSATALSGKKTVVFAFLASFGRSPTRISVLLPTITIRLKRSQWA